MKPRSTAIIFIAMVTCLTMSFAYADPGRIDINGGHYSGNSYHCHQPGCEIPDTFDRFGRDSFFTDYKEREQFFNEIDWSYDQDYDDDCQTTRQEMLILTSRVEVTYTNPRNCQVRSGQWLDEYTGKIFTVASQIDLDHIIPLIYAHSHGGDLWPEGKKLQFANDPNNLILVEKREIRRKQGRSLDSYLPREEYQCKYAHAWEVIAERYDLELESRDKNKIKRILRDCPEFPE